MISFHIAKKSKHSRARIGVMETSHGVVETPSLVPVATQAVVKTLTSEEVLATKSQILIANTFHLHLKPGEKIVKEGGKLHSFMNWPKPLMTDSAGFQVFSLGFGSDLKVGKVTKYFPGSESEKIKIKRNSQPISVKITPDGVFFRSPVDGRRLFIGPKESMRIQQDLGADIIFAFDECTSPYSSPAYIKEALKRTHRWAKICLETKKSNQALFGIVQGSKYKELRHQSAKYIASLPFDGYGIGGDLGESKETMKKILNWTIPHLNQTLPRHLLGIGYLEDMENIIKAGVDLFDCTVPTHYGRRGVAFTSHGELNFRQKRYLTDKKPLDAKCDCTVCQNYKRTYIAHLFRAGEVTAMKFLSFHNIYYFNTYVERLRERIKNNRL